MEVGITEFRKNLSSYFDKVYFEKENIILRKRGYKLKLTYEIDDEHNFDAAATSDIIKNQMEILASKI